MKVAIVMGSKSDLPIMQEAIDILKDFHIETEPVSIRQIFGDVIRSAKVIGKEKNIIITLKLLVDESILKILKEYYGNMSYKHIRRRIGRTFEKQIPIIFSVIKELYDQGRLEKQ